MHNHPGPNAIKLSRVAKSEGLDSNAALSKSEGLDSNAVTLA